MQTPAAPAPAPAPCRQPLASANALTSAGNRQQGKANTSVHNHVNKQATALGQTAGKCRVRLLER